MNRYLRVAVLCVLVALPVLGTGAAPAHAHAIVESTEPSIDQVVESSPERIVMHFNEPVEIAFGAVRVFDTNANRVDSGDAEHLEGDASSIAIGLEPDLADGTYTVTWRVVSADGHPIEEAFVFHVGAPGKQPGGLIIDPGSGAGPVTGVLYGIARWLNFIGLLLLAGGVIFLARVWRPTGAAGDPMFVARWRRIVVTSWVVVLIATIASLVLQVAVVADLPMGEATAPSVLGQAFGARFGVVAVVKLVLLGLAAGLWWLGGRRFGAARSAGAAEATEPRPLLGAALAIVVALLFTPAFAGHAGTTDPVALNIFMDGLHLVAGAGWIGGLVILLVAVFPAASASSEPAAGLAPTVKRFSDMALIAVGVIVATGVYASWIEVRAFRALTGATYGVVLLSKIGVFIPIVLLGAINNRVMKPRIERAAGDRAAPLRVFKRVVMVEVALAAVVLALTALLVNLPPARVAAGVEGPFVQDVRLDENNLNVLVDPNQVGRNEIHLTATTSSGAPLEVKEMRVLLTMPEQDIGPLVGRGKKLAPGHFVVQGNQLSVPGEWRLEVVVRVGRFEETRTSIVIEVH